MPADTFSNTLGFTIMGTGNDNNTWGSIANTNVFQIFEDAIANFLTSAVSGGTLDLSGSPPPAAASQVRYAALLFTGALGSNQILQVPNLTKLWWVDNQTSGAHTLTIKTPSGSASTAIPQNSGWQLVICDGANNIIVLPFNSKQVQMPDGAVGTPPYSYLNEPTSGWYRAGAGDHRLSVLGTDEVKVTSTTVVIPTNTLTPGGGIVGVTDGSNAAAGIVGEYQSATVTSAALVNLPAGTPTNITSLVLTAGDWDVWGDLWVSSNYSDTGSFIAGALSLVSATLPLSTALPRAIGFSDLFEAGISISAVGLRLRVSSSGSTTVYLVAQSEDGHTSPNGGFGQIQARRVR